MPVKYHPHEPYVRRVPAWKMHFYTMVQVLALAILWSVKSSNFSLAFPFFLIMMVPLRQRLTMFFNPRELNAVNDWLVYSIFMNRMKSAWFFMYICFFSSRFISLYSVGWQSSIG